jgi:RNA polymerase sigma-70 factor (ECF subfamily)
MSPPSRTPVWTDALHAARRDPGSKELESLLRDCQAYLLLVARQEWPRDLQAKEGPSDLVQQTLIEAFQDFHQFQGATQAEWLGWVRRILLNNLHNVVKHYSRRRRDVAREAPDPGSSVPARWSAVAAPDPTPHTHLQGVERAALLEQTLAGLPEHYQRVIRLRHEEGLPFAEIGRRMGCSGDAAQKVWARAVKELAQRLRGQP